jgi:hypothetical protein
MTSLPLLLTLAAFGLLLGFGLPWAVETLTSAEKGGAHAGKRQRSATKPR